MTEVRKLSLILLGILILSISLMTFSSSMQQVIVNVAPTPYYSGYYPQGVIGITTTGSSATFNLYLFNPTFSQESVPVYVNSSLYTTVTLPPYSYQAVPISLSLGTHVITVEGQTLYVNVYHSSYSPITTYINGTPNVYVLQAQPGKTYNFQVSFSSIPNGTMTSFIYTDIGFFKSPTYQQGATPTLTPQNTFLLQVPKGIPQGVYYAYIYTEFNNATNGALLSYSFGIIIINVSYGIPSTLSSPKIISENGVTIEMQNISGYTYLYIESPFTYQNSYTITTPSGTVEIENLTETNNVFPAFITTPQLLYYGSTVPIAISPNGVIVKLPQFGTATITIKSPTGVETLTIPPKITVAKLNVEVLSTTGVPIPNAKVYIYNLTAHSLITTEMTNSSGFISYSLPIGSEVNITASALGYFTNSTTITVSGTTTVKIYLTPIKITITPVKFTENGSLITPVEISIQKFFTNITVGSTLSLVFSVNINGNVTPSVTASLNGSEISITPLGNGEYEVTQTFKAPGNYVLTINASYNGVSQTLSVLVHVQQITVITSTTTTSTTTSSTTTTVTPTTTTVSSSTTTTTITPTTPVTTTPSTTPTTTATSSFPITDVIIIVVIIVIIAIAAIVVLRR